MIHNYLEEDVTFYIKEGKDYKGNKIYKVCYETEDGSQSGYIKFYKYYKDAENFIKNIHKTEITKK